MNRLSPNHSSGRSFWEAFETLPRTWVWSLGQEDPLEKEMATHSSILTWRIPRTMSLPAYSHGVTNSWTWLQRLSTHPPECSRQDHVPGTLSADLINAPFPFFPCSPRPPTSVPWLYLPNKLSAPTLGLRLSFSNDTAKSWEDQMSQFGCNWRISQIMGLLVLKLGKPLANQDELTLVRHWKGRDTREKVAKRKVVKKGQCPSIVYAISFTTSRNTCHAVVGSP